MIYVISITILIIYLVWRLFIRAPTKIDAKVYLEGWYGKDLNILQNSGTEESAKNDSVRPFKIHVSDDILADLKSRLERTRFEESLIDAKFHYGFNSSYLKRIVEYWKTDYNWRKQEEELNRFLHFKTCIEGIDVHFMHITPVLPEERKLKVLPLMIIHGWPGSIVEFCKIIPFLTTPRAEHNFVFEVICPSIPGYGFSESPHREGFDCIAAARIFKTLMERLGHPKFYVQGGDWGSIISSLMSKYYPSRILGVHLNFYASSPKSWDLIKYVLAGCFPFLINKEEYKAAFPLKKVFYRLLEETGYMHLQSTKPDTLGCAVTDSPAGMAAYILEKFGVWTHKEAALQLVDGGITQKFSIDELLTNVMLYWVNNNFTASTRFYKENIKDLILNKHDKVPITVPSAVAFFPNELISLPKICMSQQLINLVSYTIMPRGGHFAAMEEPQLLADDIWKFVKIVEKKSS